MSSKEKQPIDPTIIIGVGGAGCGMVADIRDMIRNDVVVGEKDSIDKRFQYIAIDSDEDDTMPKIDTSDENVLEIDLDKSQIGMETARTDMDSQEYHYLSDSAGYRPDDMSGGTGAERNRAIGRYCVNKHHDDLRDALSQRIGLTVSEFAGRVGDESTNLNNIHIWVVNSLCGGTGSGSFIEIAAMVKDIVEDEYDSTSGEVGAGDFSIKGVGSLLVWDDDSYDSNFRRNAYASLEDITKTVRKERGGQDKTLRIPRKDDIEVPGYLFDEYFLQSIDYSLDQDVGKQDGYRRQRNRVIGSLVLLWSKTGGTEDIRTDYLATLSDRENSEYRINALAGMEIKAPMGGIYAYSVRDKAIEELEEEEEELKECEEAYETDIESIDNAIGFSVKGPFSDSDQNAHEWEDERSISDELSENGLGSEPTVDELENSLLIDVETGSWREELKNKIENVVAASVSAIGKFKDAEDLDENKLKSAIQEVIEESSTDVPDSKADLEYYDGNKEDDQISEYVFSQIASRNLADRMRDHGFHRRTEKAEKVYERVMDKPPSEADPTYLSHDDPRKKWDRLLASDFFDRYRELDEKLKGIIPTIAAYIGIPFTYIGTKSWVRRKYRRDIIEVLDDVYTSDEEGKPEPVEGGLYDQYGNLSSVYSEAKRGYEGAEDELESIKQDYERVKRELGRTRNTVEEKREKYEKERSNIEDNISPPDEGYGLRPEENDHAAWIDLRVVMEELGGEVERASKHYVENYYGVEQEIKDELNGEETEDNTEDEEDEELLKLKDTYEVQLEGVNHDFEIDDVRIDYSIEEGSPMSIKSLYTVQELFEEVDISDAFAKARDRLDGFEMEDIYPDPDEDSDVEEEPVQALMVMWKKENEELMDEITEGIEAGGETLEEIINSFGKEQTSKLSMNDPYRVWMTLLYSGLEGMKKMSEYVRLREEYTNGSEEDVRSLSETFIYPELHLDDDEIGGKLMNFHDTYWLEKEET